MMTKARVKATGEIVEVCCVTDGLYEDIDGHALYSVIDLDFNLDSPHPEATISGWVARDEGGGLYLHSIQPRKGAMEWHGDRQPLTLPIDSFPDLTWQDEPIEVEITIKPKKQ